MGQIISQFFAQGLSPVEQEAEAFADVLKQMTANEHVVLRGECIGKLYYPLTH
jgi:hypothetical protein